MKGADVYFQNMSIKRGLLVVIHIYNECLETHNAILIAHGWYFYQKILKLLDCITAFNEIQLNISLYAYEQKWGGALLSKS